MLRRVLCAAALTELMNWFAVACELHRDWRNDIEGLPVEPHSELPQSHDELLRPEVSCGSAKGG
jgi:hypothetical protein